jgi:pimeloyl-ACP methyl ester carboxylesterase
MRHGGASVSIPTNFVFLHGGGQGSWVWDETMQALERQAGNGSHRVLSLDIPGCGRKRDRVTSDLDVRRVVTELVDDIERAGLRDIILVGHSQAGTVLPLLIEARPALIRRSVFVSCLAPLTGQSALEWVATMPDADSTLKSLASTVDMRSRYRAMFCNDMSPEEAQIFLDKLQKDAWPAACYQESPWRYDHLGAVPSSYVLCLRDATLPPRWQEIFAERFKAQRLVRIDAGHQVMNTRPHALAEILRIEAGIA